MFQESLSFSFGFTNGGMGRGGQGASFNIYFLGVKSTVTITPFQRLIVRY